MKLERILSEIRHPEEHIIPTLLIGMTLGFNFGENSTSNSNQMASYALATTALTLYPSLQALTSRELYKNHVPNLKNVFSNRFLTKEAVKTGAYVLGSFGLGYLLR